MAVCHVPPVKIQSYRPDANYLSAHELYKYNELGISVYISVRVKEQKHVTMFSVDSFWGTTFIFQKDRMTAAEHIWCPFNDQFNVGLNTKVKFIYQTENECQQDV